MKIRCVVTGQDAEGKSVFASDSLVEPLTLSLLPGTEFHRLWGSDRPPTLPTNGSPPSQPAYFPPPGGYRFAFFTLGPEEVVASADLDLGAALAQFAEKLPGMAEVMEPDRPGMHTTDTVDVDVVVSGEVWLELDDGREVHLLPGQVVIQNGTRHAWHNRTSAPCVIFVTLLGAERATRS